MSNDPSQVIHAVDGASINSSVKTGLEAGFVMKFGTGSLSKSGSTGRIMGSSIVGFDADSILSLEFPIGVSGAIGSIFLMTSLISGSIEKTFLEISDTIGLLSCLGDYICLTEMS